MAATPVQLVKHILHLVNGIDRTGGCGTDSRCGAGAGSQGADSRYAERRGGQGEAHGT
jgi:hypothetical protein